MDILRPAPKTCFFGSRTHFSATVFTTLINQGVTINQVFCSGIAPVKARVSCLPISQPTMENSLDKLAAQHHIPIQFLNSISATHKIPFAQIPKPDFILVACFPFILPESIINWPIVDCLNIHPSLLPMYRGPDPLFWQLRNGEQNTGVSLHRITTDIDSGPIVMQANYPFKDGAQRKQLTMALASIGASLFIEATTSDTQLKVSAQAQTRATYDPYPTDTDYEISTDWSARQAFNFIQGTSSARDFYLVNTHKEILKITTAIDYTNTNYPEDYQNSQNDELLIPFSPGILRVKLP